MSLIKELYFYPIKSFRGLKVNRLELDPFGAKFDRQWMMIDVNGQFITQRTHPELAQISLTMDEYTIELSQDGFGSIDFGLEERAGDEFMVQVWKDEVPAYEVSREVSEWLAERLKQKFKLVRLSDRARRPGGVDSRSVRFQDQKPLLVIAQASLDELIRRCGVGLEMIRFRPNIVVDGVEAHAEDSWPGFQIGDIEFKAQKACIRCRITATDPLTGAVGQEPLKTLATYRRTPKGVAFGYYYGHLNEGVIDVGSSLSVLL